MTPLLVALPPRVVVSVPTWARRRGPAFARHGSRNGAAQLDPLMARTLAALPHPLPPGYYRAAGRAAGVHKTTVWRICRGLAWRG